MPPFLTKAKKEVNIVCQLLKIFIGKIIHQHNELYHIYDLRLLQSKLFLLRIWIALREWSRFVWYKDFKLKKKDFKLTGKNHGKNDKKHGKILNYNRYQTEVNQVATAYSLASHWRKCPVKAFLFLLARIVSLICLSSCLNKVTWWRGDVVV